MDTPTTKAALLSAMETARREWDSLLSHVDEQALVEPGVEGVWSVKQIVAHIAGYEEWAAAFLTDRLDPTAGALTADYADRAWLCYTWLVRSSSGERL